MIILISGGTGLIGKPLTRKLIEKGHEVRILSRNKAIIEGCQVFKWDYQNDFIEAGAFENVEILVHLAGEGIADKPWTAERKKSIISSRVDSLNFLKKHVKPSLKTIIGGSAIGYYGADTGEEIQYENSIAGNDFLAECTVKWEAAEDDFAVTHNLRKVKIRTGVVLDKNGGALLKMAQPIKLYAGSPLGSGKQWMSWIHMSDLVDIFIESIENKAISGIINAVAPNPERNVDFTKKLAKALKRPLFLPNVPAFILKTLLGELAVVVTGSSRVGIKNPIITYKYPKLEDALVEIYV